MKQSYQTEFEKLSWKEICMRLLRCFGEINDNWHHKDWYEYGIDRKHGKIIVEQYEQWMEDNELQIESGIRTDVSESFLVGLKSLFDEHYVDIPDEKYNILEELQQQISSLEENLEKELQMRTILLNEMVKKKIFSFQEVQDIVNHYYKDPKAVLKAFGINLDEKVGI